jgi:hypothetical protein
VPFPGLIPKPTLACRKHQVKLCPSQVTEFIFSVSFLRTCWRAVPGIGIPGFSLEKQWVNVHCYRKPARASLHSPSDLCHAVCLVSLVCLRVASGELTTDVSIRPFESNRMCLCACRQLFSERRDFGPQCLWASGQLRRPTVPPSKHVACFLVVSRRRSALTLYSEWHGEKYQRSSPCSNFHWCTVCSRPTKGT